MFPLKNKDENTYLRMKRARVDLFVGKREQVDFSGIKPQTLVHMRAEFDRSGRNISNLAGQTKNSDPKSILRTSYGRFT